MSQVITTAGVQRLFGDIVQYIGEFHGFLEASRIKLSGLTLPDYSADIFSEENEIFFSWLAASNHEILSNVWKFHRFGPTAIEDWPNPIEYLDRPDSPLRTVVLPQYPQVRRKVCGRSIRIKV